MRDVKMKRKRRGTYRLANDLAHDFPSDWVIVDEGALAQLIGTVALAHAIFEARAP
jgi:hypothetical protein